MDILSNNNNYDFFIYVSYIITFASLIIVFLYTYLKYLISKKLFKAIIENVNDPQKNRLFGLMLFFIPLSLGVFFLMSALKSNIVYFISPSELVNSNNINQKLRLGGLVEEDSIIINGKLVKFRITDGNKSVLVQYNGILPDLFKEKQGVIVEGEFDSLIFNANNLLAKHDENYIPKEVANSLKQQGLWKGKTEIE